MAKFCIAATDWIAAYVEGFDVQGLASVDSIAGNIWSGISDYQKLKVWWAEVKERQLIKAL